MSENPAVSGLKTAYQEYLEANATVTYVLMTVVAAVFLTEVVLAAVLGLQNVRIFATGLFGIHPWIAWPFSPVLHRGILHFAATLTGLTVVGSPIEKYWDRRRYAAFLTLTAYITVLSGAVFMSVFSDEQLAFYGTSGVIYALAGFSLTHLTKRHDDLNLVEWLAVVIGIAALIDVLIDPLTGPYFAPNWINGGHTSGFVIGSAIGLLQTNK